MWRVALSTIAILADVVIALLAGIGMSEPSVQAGAHSVSQAPASMSAGAAGPVVAMLVLFGLNILAILFGARLKLPGNRIKAVSAVFE